MATSYLVVRQDNTSAIDYGCVAGAGAAVDLKVRLQASVPFPRIRLLALHHSFICSHDGWRGRDGGKDSKHHCAEMIKVVGGGNLKVAVPQYDPTRGIPKVIATAVRLRLLSRTFWYRSRPDG